ncbi:metallophosphoesterase family protein [Deinococcus sp. SDU3-2]|uniref:Metallophosphoesterase family protein n=1 Tax=Deinococcus terrestris TaxID=2651870 RepID=A0A7X1NX23_9DEIO|nr:metallophosphoesterase family protein [Deinococcus terrestris]MPY66929.1 metallophosphoesterase family protein [Deinococcus terrestris]
MPPVRLAVIADIHGNADALRAVLADARAQGAERVLVNGDVVNRGPDSVEALSLLLSRDDVTFTLGNHDDLVRLWHGRSDTLPGDWFTDPFWGATDWTATELSRAGLLEVPADWPMTRTLEAPGLPSVLVAHGTPADYRESLSERTDPRRVAELAGGAGVLVGSHIHRPAQVERGGVLVLNTGAAGTPMDGDPRTQYLLLTATPGGWVPELRRVPYDRSGVLRRFETSGLLSTGVSAEIFRDEVLTARSLYTPYWVWTEQGGLPRDAATWAAFRQGVEG